MKSLYDWAVSPAESETEADEEFLGEIVRPQRPKRRTTVTGGPEALTLERPSDGRDGRPGGPNQGASACAHPTHDSYGN